MPAGPFWGGAATSLGSDLPASYFAEAAAAFEQARAVCGDEQDFRFTIGGVRFRMRILGSALAGKITRTLSHLRDESAAEPDFTVCCFDDKAAGAPLPRPRRWMLGMPGKHLLPSLCDGRYQAFFVEAVKIVSCLDLGTRTGYSCYLEAGRLSMYEVSGPMRPIVNAVLNTRGMQLVHASAVGTPEGSLLFAGRPFSGKSTVAVRCLLDGLGYQGDDLCVLTDDAKPRSLCLYNIAKLRADAAPQFEKLAPALEWFEEDAERKAFFYVNERMPAQLLREAPVRAVVLPRIVNADESRLEPATAREVLDGLVKYTLLEIPSATALGDGILLHAVKRLPAWNLFLGRDHAQTLALVRGLLVS